MRWIHPIVIIQNSFTNFKSKALVEVNSVYITRLHVQVGFFHFWKRALKGGKTLLDEAGAHTHAAVRCQHA